MKLGAFVLALQNVLPAGLTLANPGGGTSTIVDCSSNSVRYRRGRSEIAVSMESLHKAYLAYQGRRVTSADLREYAPSVFDSHARPAGHSCNVTFLFLALHRAGLASEIGGKGVRGNPFFVMIR